MIYTSSPGQGIVMTVPISSREEVNFSPMESNSLAADALTANAGKVHSRGKRIRSEIRKNVPLLLLTLPMVIYIFIFSYLPMIGSVIAFKRLNYAKGILGSEWIGFENFKFFFASPDALSITLHTIGYNLVFIALNLAAAVFVALLLYEIQNRVCLKSYQTFMFIPNLLSWVIVAYMAYAFLNPRSGMLNQLLEFMGKEPVDWYSTPFKWIFILPLANLWKGIGMGALMYYASLMGIDKDYFEAASIEGASKLQITWHISLPFLYPLMTILTLLHIGGIFSSDFGLFYQLPMNSPLLYSTTDVLDTYIYRALSLTGDIGMSSAAGLFKSVVGFVLVVVSNAVVKKVDPEYSLY